MTKPNQIYKHPLLETKQHNPCINCNKIEEDCKCETFLPFSSRNDIKLNSEIICLICSSKRGRTKRFYTIKSAFYHFKSHKNVDTIEKTILKTCFIDLQNLSNSVYRGMVK